MAHRLARIALSVGLLAFMYSCCAATETQELKFWKDPVPAPTPNLNGVLSTVGRFNMCHACPIAPDLALTAAHCIDPRPFDPSVPPFGARYSNADGTVTGIAEPLAIAQTADLAVVELIPPAGGYYPMALDGPEPGAVVWWLGYDYRRKRDALKPRRMSAELVNIVAGNLVAGTVAEEGSSGGCVLSARSEVVGVVNWRLFVGVDDAVSIGVGVWGSWPEDLISQARERQAKRKEASLRELLDALGLEGEKH